MICSLGHYWAGRFCRFDDWSESIRRLHGVHLLQVQHIALDFGAVQTALHLILDAVCIVTLEDGQLLGFGTLSRSSGNIAVLLVQVITDIASTVFSVRWRVVTV